MKWKLDALFLQSIFVLFTHIHVIRGILLIDKVRAYLARTSTAVQ